MSTPLILACLWLVIANVTAMLPSRDHHWRAAYALIAAGIPIVGYVTWQHGAIAGLLVLAGGASVLRWPVYYLAKWLRRMVQSKPE